MANQQTVYTITAKDQSAAGVASFIRNVQRAQAANTQFVAQGKKGNTQLVHSLGQVSAGTQQYAKIAQQVATTVVRQLAAMQLGFKGIALTVGTVRSAFSLAATGAQSLAQALTALGKRGVEVNLSLQNTERGLATMLRSAGMARTLMQALRKEATTSTFEFVDLADMSKRLLAFGFTARQVLPIIRTLGDASAGLGSGKEGLDRLVTIIGQIKAKGVLQGDEALQLGEAGINIRSLLGLPEGTNLGDIKLGANRAIPIIMQGLQQQFGGLQQGAAQSIPGLFSNIQDQINELAATVTEKLTGSIQRALANVLALLGGLRQTAAGQRLIQSLGTIFGAVGNVIEGASLKLGGFVEWLSKVATAENVALFLSNVIGLLRTLGETILKVMGVDLRTLTDPKAFVQFFDTLGQKVADFIDGVFGVARVFREVRTIVAEAIRDMGNRIADTTQDMLFSFQRMFLGLQQSIHGLSAGVLEAFLSIGNAINRSPVLRWMTNGGIDTDSLLTEMTHQQVMESAAGISIGRIDFQRGVAQQARRTREAGYDQEDPRRHMDPMARITSAYNTPDAAQNEFWARFSENRLNAQRGLFAGLAAGTFTGPMSPGTQLYGTTPRTGPSVRRIMSPMTPGATLPGMRGLPNVKTLEEANGLVELIQARIENNPVFAFLLTQQELIPALRRQVQLLSQATPYESPEKALERLQKLQGAAAQLREAQAGAQAGQQNDMYSRWGAVKLPNGQVVDRNYARMMGLLPDPYATQKQAAQGALLQNGMGAFDGVRLPDGRVISRQAAMMMGVIPNGAQPGAPGIPGALPSAFGLPAPNFQSVFGQQNGMTVINLQIPVQGNFAQVPEMAAEATRRELDRLMRQAYPGPSY